MSAGYYNIGAYPQTAYNGVNTYAYDEASMAEAAKYAWQISASVGAPISEEKRKQLETLYRKRQLDDRIRNRGKRAKANKENANTDKSAEPESDKEKAYLAEMRKYRDQDMSDGGGHVRPLVK